MSPIHITRRAASMICRLMVGVLLFAQLSTAAYACTRLSSASASAAAVERAAVTLVAAPCHEARTESPNLCAEHCRFGEQSAEHASAPLPGDAVLAMLYAVPRPSEAVARVEILAAREWALAAPPPPPHTVLHCCRRV